MSATAQIRVGIIGTGAHGSRYARHLLGREVEGLELSAISRRSAAGSAQAGEWGVGYHPDWRALVADRRVAAVIAEAGIPFIGVSRLFLDKVNSRVNNRAL